MVKRWSNQNSSPATRISQKCKSSRARPSRWEQKLISDFCSFDIGPAKRNRRAKLCIKMTVCVTCCGYVTVTRRGTQQTQRAGVSNQNKDESTRFYFIPLRFMMMISMMLVGSLKTTTTVRRVCSFCGTSRGTVTDQSLSISL